MCEAGTGSDQRRDLCPRPAGCVGEMEKPDPKRVGKGDKAAGGPGGGSVLLFSLLLCGAQEVFSNEELMNHSQPISRSTSKTLP